MLVFIDLIWVRHGRSNEVSSTWFSSFTFLTRSDVHGKLSLYLIVKSFNRISTVFVLFNGLYLKDVPSALLPRRYHFSIFPLNLTYSVLPLLACQIVKLAVSSSSCLFLFNAPIDHIFLLIMFVLNSVVVRHINNSLVFNHDFLRNSCTALVSLHNELSCRLTNILLLAATLLARRTSLSGRLLHLVRIVHGSTAALIDYTHVLLPTSHLLIAAAFEALAATDAIDDDGEYDGTDPSKHAKDDVLPVLIVFELLPRPFFFFCSSLCGLLCRDSGSF